ncbi:MAG TPA: PssD/Cps14F family polysaccharide biosynthesis glycosyltransferase [Clostridia bacterium]|nr:PssD/Cps14F family polysaccharide biosynthesis glycosyltransferase [Clostridia bacterium]
MEKILFISSTGGHLNELLQLKPMFKDFDYNIVTEKDNFTISLKNEYKDKIYYLPYGTRSKMFSYPFKYFFLCLKSIYLYFKIKPKFIITTGTHTVVPICYLAKIFGTKIIFIETFANSNSKTVSGKLLYPISDLFIVQWESMLELYPKAKFYGGIY